MSDAQDLTLAIRALTGALGALEEAVRELTAKQPDKKPPSSKRGGKGGAS